jgi:hypothetical protein
LDCGSIAFGDRGADVQHDMWHHREHYCPDAEIEVSALELRVERGTLGRYRPLVRRPAR